MDQLKAMRTFVCVVDQDSFAGAARALDLAPAVVTRAVADLEQHLGARLIQRTTRSRTLTDVGRAYLERARAILAAVDDATALASASQTEARGHVRLRAGPAFAVHQLPQRLARFHAAHPQVTVEVTAHAPAATLDETHDLTLIAQREPLDGDFVAHRLAKTEIIACAQPGYLDSVGRPRHPRELADRAFLVPTGWTRRPLSFERVAGDGTAVGVMPTASPISSGNHELNQAAALAGLGIAGLPSFLVEKDLRAGRLERVLPGWRLFDMTIWACMPSRKLVPASTRALLEFLRAEFGGEDRDPWAAPASAPALATVAPVTPVAAPRVRLALAA